MHPEMTQLEHGLQRFCEAHFPDYHGLRVADLTPITEGWENEVYAYVMHYDLMDEPRREDLILRLYPGMDAPDKSVHEFHTMKRLYDIGYPVPEVHLLEPDSRHLGKPFVIMQKIDGCLLEDAARRASPCRRQQLLHLFCRLFVQLHSLDWRMVLPEAVQHLHSDPSANLLDILTWFEERVQQLGQHAFLPVFEWLRSQFSEVKHYEPCLIHCDYHPFNILIREDDEAFVIDWGSARVWDRRLDLALTFILVGRQTAQEILTEYQRIVGFAIEQIEPFEVAAALNRLVNIRASLTAGAEHLGMRPGAEDLMRQQVGHIQEVYQLLQDRTGLTVSAVEDLIADLSS